MQQKESRNSEKSVIENFINNRENTMASWPSVTIANSLLNLSEKYGLDSPEMQEKIIIEIDLWIDALAKPASDLPEKEAAAVKAEAARVKAAFNKLKNKMDEETNELDAISLIRNGQKINYEISIKRTLAIVFYALAMDTSLSKENLNDRLYSFKRMILKMETKNDCHQGWRHTIAELLIGVHPDVHIIIDMISFIFNIVSDHKYHLLMKLAETNHQKLEFWKKLFEKAKAGEEHPLLIQAFENSQTELMLTLKNKLEKYDINLKELYEYKDIKNILDNLTQINLSLPLGSDLFLQALAHLFTLENINNPLTEKAVTRIKHYLKAHPEIFHKAELQESISGFYVNLKAFELFEKYKKILAFWNEEEITAAEIAHLSPLFKDYFETCFTPADPEKSKTLQEDLSKALEKFSTAVVLYEKDFDTSGISNFFSLWKLGRNENNAAHQVQLCEKLIDPVYKKKIMVSDEFLTNIYMQHENRNVYLSPYLINRVFMHALSLPVAAWTVLFHEVFSDVLTFVSAGFHSEDNRFQAESLKKDSYPPELIQQLEYLKNYSENNNDNNIAVLPTPVSFYIPMPHFAKSIREFNSMFEWANNKQKIEFLKRMGDEFIKNIIKNVDELKKILKMFPKTERLTLLANLGMDFKSTPIKDTADLKKILKMFPETERLTLLASLDMDFKSSLIKSAADLSMILERLDYNDILSFLASLDTDFKSSLIKTAADLSTILERLDYNDILSFLASLDMDFKNSLIKNTDELKIILEMFNKTERLNLLASFGMDFKRSPIKDAADLKKILKMFPKTDRLNFLASLDMNFKSSLIKTAAELSMILERLDDDDRLNFLISLDMDFKNSLIKNADELKMILEVLPRTGMIIFLESLKRPTEDVGLVLHCALLSGDEAKKLSYITKIGYKHIKNHIKSYEDLKFILRLFPEDNKISFCESLGNNFIKSFIKSRDDLAVVLGHLPASTRRKFWDELDIGFIKEFINSTHDLIVCLLDLPEEERLIYMGKFENDFIKSLIKTAEDLRYMLTYNLRATEILIYINNLGTDFIKSLIKSITDLNIILSRLLPDDRIILVNNLGMDNIEGFIKNDKDLESILKLVPGWDYQSFSQSLEASRSKKLHKETSDNAYLPLHSGSYEARSRKNSQNADQENVQVNSTQTISSNRRTVSNERHGKTSMT